MTLANWLWLTFSLIATLIFTVIVWIGGPLITIDDSQPLGGLYTRLLIILAAWAIVLGVIGWKVWKRRRAAAKLRKALTESVEEDSDARVLKTKMEDALATLKRTSKSGADALYDLPWYLIIGPPGSGKTTALVNSGLKFPLAGDRAAQAIEGVGGTRYCDWWFTDQAVLIDTAGRYTTQDSDAKADKKSWLAFISMLRENRPRQPINGVIVAISIADLLGLEAAEVYAHAEAIRKRLAELHEELKISFPVYVVLTKMDLIAGFTQYFADLDEVKRQAVWGATFQTPDRSANLVGQAPEEIDLLIRRLSERMAERLQDEPDLRSRTLMFGLPAQISAIRKPVCDFLNRVFEPTRYQASAALRGFYFTSATQEGTPFDAVIGALRRSFGLDNVGAATLPAFSGPGKTFFLHDLLVKVIFAEAGWVSTNIAAVRRAFALRAASFAALALVVAALLGAWWVSYDKNTALIADTSTGLDAFLGTAGPSLKANPVRDTDLRTINQVLDGLPPLPAGWGRREESTPVTATFGLSQRSRTEVVSFDAYHQALDRLLRPRLLLSLEQQLRANVADANFVYEGLKIYLMLGAKAPKLEKSVILNWFTRQWETDYPGGSSAPLRAELRGHLQAMLDLDAESTPMAIGLDGDLVQQAQATLASMPLALRAYTLLKAEALGAEIEDWVATQRLGPGLPLVFETVNGASLDSVRVPGFFTRAGFNALLGSMPSIADKMKAEKWVLGPSAEQGSMEGQYSNLYWDIIELYRRDFVATWMAALNNLRVRQLFDDKPDFRGLAAAAAPTSPIVLLLESVRDETQLTREPPKPPGSAVGGAAESVGQRYGMNQVSNTGLAGRMAVEIALKSQRRPGQAKEETPEERIESAFKEYIELVDAGPRGRMIDSLIANLNEIYVALHEAAENPSTSRPALDRAQEQVAYLQSAVSRVPAPVSVWIEKMSKDAAGTGTRLSIDEINTMLAQDVTPECQRIVGGHYPFSKGADVPLADFERLFAPNGIIDKYFSANLAPLANISGKTWSWRSNPNLNRKLSEAALHSFQQAADIRDAFFPTGGNTPNVTLEVRMLSLNSAATTATLAVAGGAQFIGQSSGPATPGQIQWPGAGAGVATLTLAPDMPDQKSTLERQGPWALFHLVDTAPATTNGNSVSAGFVLGARDVRLQFTAGTASNPLTMPALRQFKCPSALW